MNIALWHSCRWRTHLAKMVVTHETYHLQGARIVTKSPALANIVDLDIINWQHLEYKRIRAQERNHHSSSLVQNKTHSLQRECSLVVITYTQILLLFQFTQFKYLIWKQHLFCNGRLGNMFIKIRVKYISSPRTCHRVPFRSTNLQCRNHLKLIKLCHLGSYSFVRHTDMQKDP
jgi:hypothetical protein